MNDIQQILTFWFEGLNDRIQIDKNAPVVRKWFMKNERFDQEIKDKFQATFLKARQGEYKKWEDIASGRLALVILFDQFSRNIYRGTAQAFAADSLALELTLKSFKDNKDQELQLIERLFLYMPLMHAENLEVQDISIGQFHNLVEESKIQSPQNTAYYEYTLKYAKSHRDIIKRFGRFPHRNAGLGRRSTKEEEEFLKKPGSSF